MVHNSLHLPLILCVDSSPIATGSVLAHVVSDGSERPIAYASRRFTDTETRYSQFDKELYGLVIAIKKFHMYVGGRRFHVYLDNLPVVRLLQKRLPDVASPRVLRWMLFLSAYAFSVEFRPSSKHGNADALSRLPDPAAIPDPVDVDVDDDIVTGVYFWSPPSDPGAALEIPASLSAGELARATAVDPTLRIVAGWVANGWPQRCPDRALQPYFRRRASIMSLRGCLLYGDRVILPDSLLPLSLIHI